MSKRTIQVVGDLAYVPLTKGFVAVVDVLDLHIVDGYNWFVKVDKRCAYAMRKSRVAGKRKTLLMHREIVGAQDGLEVDHKDCDGLNNRRLNLRVATHQQNTQNARKRADNRSGVKGIHWSKANRRWVASIRVDGKQKHIGSFADKKDAIDARVSAALGMGSEFVRHE